LRARFDPAARDEAHDLASGGILDWAAVQQAGCAIVAVLSPVIWLASRLTAPGDLFYRHERIGAESKSFQVIKFRSMVMDSEKGTGAVWAKENDSRATPVGRILRKTRIDELPRFWNVLRGEMSLVASASSARRLSLSKG
jgi:lipopolysaccharide/colanic/teichoic acid biosynthesis glycosyltransferase